VADGTGRDGVTRVEIHPYSEGDLGLLHAINAPEMTEYLGGPESDDQILARHKRYLQGAEAGTARMFQILLLPGGHPAGTVGFWDKAWQGETVYETGWSVLPQFQGLGVATSATQAVVAAARAELKHRFIHAFPSVANAASNAICRKVGFTFRGEYDFEYPPGHLMRCNDWSLDLTETSATRAD
jgi:RimJ/RimL family protein N-acetyltransferase